MKIVLIGSGNVAAAIGKLALQSGNEVQMILGRSEASAHALASMLNCNYTLDPNHLVQTADIYIIAIQDREIKTLLSALSISDSAIVVHTAGGVSIDVFKNIFKNYGVLYPLQSLRKEQAKVPLIPFFLDANNQTTKELLMNFAGGLSNQVYFAGDEQRMKLHIAAVFCSNFTNYLYAVAADYCETEQIDFQSLIPLIGETAARLGSISPVEAQTGPAARRDLPTIEKHLLELNHQGHMEAEHVYSFLTHQIMASQVLK